MFVFIDESGNLPGNKDEIFVVGGFITSNPRRTAKAFRKWQHQHFPKKIRQKSEVKFSDTGLNEKLRIKTISYFTKQDIRIFYSFLKTRNIPLQYRRKKTIETGFLYTEIVEQTLQLLLPTSDLKFRVFRDFRHLKSVSQRKFDESIKLGLMPSLPSKAVIQVESLNSQNSPNIQIADWVCGALFRHYNKGKNRKEYFNILKNSIVASKELFEDFWQNSYQNKKSPSIFKER